MQLEIQAPQLDEVIAKLDELHKTMENVHLISADTASDVELIVKTVLALNKKLDTLALTAAAPGPVAQPEATETAKPAPAKRVRTPKAPPAATPTVADAAGKDHEDAADEDEEALRALVEFEAKRTTRQFGLSGTRAAIGSAADGVLRIDDVPVERLAAVLSALRAL